MTECVPRFLTLRKYQADEDVDMPDESLEECGQEWPDFEHPDVARYRMFYQVAFYPFKLQYTIKPVIIYIGLQ